MFAYTYTHDTHEYLCQVEAQRDPLESAIRGDTVWLLPADATFVPPLEQKDGHAVVWDGTSWGYVPDHRRKRDGHGFIEGSGTAYWLDGDTWETPARYMTELGELPEGALLVKPEKPQEVIDEENRLSRIVELKAMLASTDYIAAKIAEGAATRDEYAEKIAQRQAWRDEINALANNADKMTEVISDSTGYSAS